MSMAINKPQIKLSEKNNLLQSYLEFCDAQMKARTLWYLIPLVSIATIMMPIDFYLMANSNLFAEFAGLSGILLYVNLVINIIKLHTRITITVFLITVLIHILAPIANLLLHL